MPRRALVERRPWLLGSIVLALAYLALRHADMSDLYLFGLKGAAVVTLGIYAVLRHPGRATGYVLGMMLLAAASLALMELLPEFAMVLALASHLAGLGLFLQYRRRSLTGSQKAAAAALLLLTAPIAYALAGLQTDRLAMTIYALVLGAMAAAAWTSRFPRYRVGLGAVLIVASGLLAIAQTGILAKIGWAAILPLPIGYVGLLLITTGVVRALTRDHAA